MSWWAEHNLRKMNSIIGGRPATTSAGGRRGGVSKVK